MQENPSSTTPLYTLNPRSGFTERADDYVKHRPSYPLVSGLQDLYERFCDEDGLVYIVYQTNVYVLGTQGTCVPQEIKLNILIFVTSSLRKDDFAGN